MRFLLITAVALQFVVAVAAAPAPAMKATELIRTAEGHPQDSVDTLRTKADRGDPEAEYKLGLAYDVGVGAPQFSLGLMYANGRGVPQDLVRAHMWLSLAAAAQQPGARSERDLIARR